MNIPDDFSVQANVNAVNVKHRRCGRNYKIIDRV
jgi:hypothetical protein